MKALLSFFLMVWTSLVWAVEPGAPSPGPGATVKGEVVEVKDVESYTYLRLKTKDGETWAAVAKAAIKPGAKVTVENVTVMNNFESKSLKKTFPTILFGNLAGAGLAANTGGDLNSPHAGIAKSADIGDVRVGKATGANARTVAEISTKAKELKDKPVLVKGKVVKYNPGIMGKNWIHLRDGTGAEGSNDLLVTTSQETRLGDIITIKGTVRVDKDFGAGYAYKVLVEDATLQP